jgi:hypothetical protein
MKKKIEKPIDLKQYREWKERTEKYEQASFTISEDIINYLTEESEEEDKKK